MLGGSVLVDRKNLICVDVDKTTNKSRSALNFMIYQRYEQARLNSAIYTNVNRQRNHWVFPAMGGCC